MCKPGQPCNEAKKPMPKALEEALAKMSPEERADHEIKAAQIEQLKKLFKKVSTEYAKEEVAIAALITFGSSVLDVGTFDFVSQAMYMVDQVRGDLKQAGVLLMLTESLNSGKVPPGFQKV